jgi:cobalt-precorrin-5B (C1)-methyltransferase
MEEYIEKDGKRCGSVIPPAPVPRRRPKAAAFMLLTGWKKERIRLRTPKGIELDLVVHAIAMGETSVSAPSKRTAATTRCNERGPYIRYGIPHRFPRHLH